MARHTFTPFTKPCPLHPDCTLVLCRVRIDGDLPIGAALATDRPGILPGVFIWAQSRIVAGHDEATLDAYEGVLTGRVAHPITICSVTEWRTLYTAREGTR